MTGIVAGTPHRMVSRAWLRPLELADVVRLRALMHSLARMKTNKNGASVKRLLFSIAIIAITLPLHAAEGMWMPQQIPQIGDRLKALGLEIDPAAFANLTGHPMGAVVSLGGCSASFVSPQGLIATNHHCIYGSLQYNSSASNDLITNGFLARTMQDEILASPTARVYVTTAIEDVTGAITGRMPAKVTDLERTRTIERRRKEMVRSCESGGGVRCLVSSFFEGSQYLKITQMEIRDVRLVYAPAGSVGNYGGEIDNWMWPRHTGDFGFYRAYVGRDGKTADYSPENVPYRPAHFLKVATGDIDAGELVIVAGYPGVTYSYITAASVRNTIENSLPTEIRYREALIRILNERSQTDREIEIRNADRTRGLENYYKKYQGTLDAFRKGTALADREAEEAAIAKLPGSSAFLAELRGIEQEQFATQKRDKVMTWLYASSPMLSQAGTLYRLSVERAKKDADRSAGYQERDWQRITQGIARTQRQIEPASDRAGLRYFLFEAAALPPSQRIEAVDAALAATGKPTVDAQIDAFLDQLYGNTRIADAAVRTDMFDDTTAELMARNDSFIRFAAALRAQNEKIEERDERIKGALARLRPMYVAALKEVRGGALAPDANGTLRVSFGTIEGYSPRDAVRYEPFTTLPGLIAKETGEEPFNSPKTLLDAWAARRFGPYVDPELGSVPVNYLSSSHITNGNSGSATLNARGEFIGLAFDGNYDAMGSDFVVNPEVTRTIHVDVRYMLWIMDAVDRAHNLLREMSVEPYFE